MGSAKSKVQMRNGLGQILQWGPCGILSSENAEPRFRSPWLGLDAWVQGPQDREEQRVTTEQRFCLGGP